MLGVHNPVAHRPNKLIGESEKLLAAGERERYAETDALVKFDYF
jgi:hypothetical protein